MLKCRLQGTWQGEAPLGQQQAVVQPVLAAFREFS
jgi:hypothetical protein